MSTSQELTRLVKKIIYITKVKATKKWVDETRKDVVVIGINLTEIWNKDVF